MIEVRNLVKLYRGASRPALDGVSFDVGEGELFCLLGPNGAGKTTATAILTTTLARSLGRVHIAGLDPARNPALLPQYFLAGLPAYLGALSWLMPLRYAVDLTRASFYVGQPSFDHVVLEPPAVAGVVVIALAWFLLAGALLFERRERRR